MTVCAREGEDEGYVKRCAGRSIEVGRPDATQSVRRCVRVWRCVGSKASADVPCGERQQWG